MASCSRASRPTAPSRGSSRQRKTGGRAAVTAAAASSSASTTMAAAVTLARIEDATPTLRGSAPNPQVQAIRSRVNELVRRYDAALAEDAARVQAIDDAADDSDSDSDDGGRGRPPAQWKVGDVLLAAHSALARTGARTERAMVAELAREDPEVAEAMGRGEKAFELALAAAGQRAQQTHAVLARSLAMVQQLQEEAVATAVSSADASGGDDRALQRRTRELRAALEVLGRDKQTLLVQLQEQLKAHREALAVADQQGQALKRTQLALSHKAEEMRALREEAERRAGEGSQALEAAQQIANDLKGQQQLAVKASAVAETRTAELEARNRALSEELARANALLASRTLEVDTLRDAAKESEAARLLAVTDARAATEASARVKAQAESAANSRSSAGQRAQVAAVEEATRTLAKENQALAVRAEQAETEMRAMAAKLSEATLRRQQFEKDNHELARVVREMQERTRQQQQQPQSKPPVLPGRSSSFSISLRATKPPKPDGQRRKAPHRGSRATAAEDEDDLSTTSESEDEDEQQQTQSQTRRRSRPRKSRSPEAEEAARDEAELNDTMHQVVESAFPRVEARADALEDDIAQFEDSQRSPMQRLATTERLGTAEDDEVARVRAECAQELARMKTQYVTGLLEYKALVIEQYERRQGEERARHRVEIERLILLVQAKFRREMERRTQRVAQAQASLKLLYRTMVGRKGGRDGLSGVGEDQEEDDDNDDRAEDQGGEAARSPVPLKAMLRAAILAMSTSTKRSEQATVQIASIYENVTSKQPKSPRRPEPPTVVVSSKPVTPPPAVTPSPPAAVVAHVACQVSAAEFERVAFAGGLRGNAVAPEDMAGVVLPSAACFPRPADRLPSPPLSPTTNLHWRSRAELDFVDGAPLTERLEKDVRHCLPRLPPGPHFVSPALRRQLLRQLVRFFAEHQAPPPREEQDEEEEVEVAVVGSPRNTPFMRRKALEGLARGRRQRIARLIVHGDP